MVAIENSLKRNEDHPSKIDEEKFAEDIAKHLAKRGRIRDPSEVKEDLVKIVRAIKEYSSILLGLDPIREEDKIVKATSHLSAYASDKEAEDSYLEKVAPDVFEKWWQLKVAVAEALGTEPYRHEVAKRDRKTRKGKQKPPAKFKQVQKQVEKELRAKGVPEEVKVVASRLATAVWLENQIRALKESTPARIYGGVPAAELRNLREKVLAKKHVAEKAAELVEKNWMKGTIVPLEERHIDPKMLPLVREHAAGMLEDIKALAERVKRGELDYLDARTILVVERDVLDRTQEAIERTLGNPEYLIENKRAWGVEDKYLIKKEVLEKMHRELKPHLETARVKILKK
ncbi:hypothetical protein [Thermococcus sp.]|uniref:hypothetical protein n=1 Tax=Thermococcus sp. TaxID=35749 RepID=UPI00260EB859|nr:hypothetical protein [Thermococcus sp.]